MRIKGVIGTLFFVALLHGVGCSFRGRDPLNVFQKASPLKRLEFGKKVFLAQESYMKSLFAENYKQLYGLYDPYYRSLVSEDSFVSWEGRIGYDYTFPEAHAEMKPPRIYTYPKGGLLSRISYKVRKIEIASDGPFARVHVAVVDRVQMMAPVPPMDMQSDRVFFWKWEERKWFVLPVKFAPAGNHISGSVTQVKDILFPEQNATYEEISIDQLQAN